MARPYRSKEVEREHGNLEELIPELVNKLGGQKEAAQFLGVSQWFISTWLKNNDYIPVTHYVKKSLQEVIQCK